MKIEQLQLLITLSKTRTIHKAADNLFISQPALSNSLKKLESELGVILFERNSKGLIPTKIGEEMIILAEKAIHDINEIYQAADSFRWKSVTSSNQEDIYLHAEGFLVDYYLADFFFNTNSLQTKVIKEPSNLSNIPDNCPNNHYFIFLEEKHQPVIVPNTWCKYKLVDVAYAIKTSNLCALKDRTIVDEKELSLYPYAQIKTDTKFFMDFSDYLSTIGNHTPVFSSESPIVILNYIANRPAWTTGILFDQQIPKKEFFSSATRTKTIRLQTKFTHKYQLSLVAHQNTSVEIINLLSHMIRQELITITQTNKYK